MWEVVKLCLGTCWTLQAVLGKLAMDNSLLLKTKRERDIGVQVALFSNPMSKRAKEYNMRPQDIMSDLVDSISYTGQVGLATPNNIPQVNRAFSLVLQHHAEDV